MALLPQTNIIRLLRAPLPCSSTAAWLLRTLQTFTKKNCVMVEMHLKILLSCHFLLTQTSNTVGKKANNEVTLKPLFGII